MSYLKPGTLTDMFSIYMSGTSNQETSPGVSNRKLEDSVTDVWVAYSHITCITTLHIICKIQILAVCVDAREIRPFFSERMRVRDHERAMW